MCLCACDSSVCVRNSCYRAVVQMVRDIRVVCISRCACVCVRGKQKTCVRVHVCVMGLGKWTAVACFSTAPV